VKRKPTPSYVIHSASGRARAVWYDHTGKRCQKLLPGEYDSLESRKAFAQLLVEIVSSPTKAPATPDNLTLAEVFSAFLDHAEQQYRHPDGTPTGQLSAVKVAIKAFRELYADLPIAEVGPLCVKAARAIWVAEKHARVECNRRVAILKRILKWGVSEQIVPPLVYQSICTITGLQKGKTTARELPPVKAVDDRVVEATLPHLNRHIRGLIEFQRLTGCRPGEACRLRRSDIDIGGAIWLYQPTQHKGTWRGKSRTVAIGPKAQELLKEFFAPNITDYLFSPQRAVKEVIAERAEKRKTPRWPSHMKRNVDKRKNTRKLKERYTKGSYELAVDRGCDRAFPAPDPLGQREGETIATWNARLTAEQKTELKAWQKSHRWSPNQLRHAHGTKVRKAFGLEAAGAALGHSKMSATEVYAERDAQLAATVAAKLG
jgi:integrase